MEKDKNVMEELLDDFVMPAPYGYLGGFGSPYLFPMYGGLYTDGFFGL